MLAGSFGAKWCQETSENIVVNLGIEQIGN